MAGEMGIRSMLATLKRLLPEGGTPAADSDEREDDRVVDLDTALAEYDLSRPRRARRDELERMTHRELRAEAKRLGIRGYSRMNSEQLRRSISGD